MQQLTHSADENGMTATTGVDNHRKPSVLWWTLYGIGLLLAPLATNVAVTYGLLPLFANPLNYTSGLVALGRALQAFLGLVIIVPAWALLLGLNVGLAALLRRFGHLPVKRAVRISNMVLSVLCVLLLTLWFVQDRYGVSRDFLVMITGNLVVFEMLYWVGARKLMQEIVVFQ